MVHATNLTGLGASQVAVSLIPAISGLGAEPSIDFYVPSSGPLTQLALDRSRASLHPFTRRLPNGVSRFLECTVSRAYFPRYSRGITLGDIPLANVDRQVVLVHQPHLIPPDINPYSSKSVGKEVMRWLFRRNVKFAEAIVVQSDIMREQLERAYPETAGKVISIPQPPPKWFRRDEGPWLRSSTGKPVVFYPAAGYDHKNHQLMSEMARTCQFGSLPIEEIWVTLGRQEDDRVDPSISWLRNLGHLPANECLEVYGRADALFFPSLAESYGLPLVEAMALGMPVVCSDLPYSRWLCGDQAIYFDPVDPRSAWQALEDLRLRLANDWRPDWSSQLSRLPADWNEVAIRILQLLDIE